MILHIFILSFSLLSELRLFTRWSIMYRTMAKKISWNQVRRFNLCGLVQPLICFNQPRKSSNSNSATKSSTSRQRSVRPVPQFITFDIISRCFENKNNNWCETKNCKNYICLLFTNPFLATLRLGRPGIRVARLWICN